MAQHIIYCKQINEQLIHDMHKDYTDFYLVIFDQKEFDLFRKAYARECFDLIYRFELDKIVNPVNPKYVLETNKQEYKSILQVVDKNKRLKKSLIKIGEAQGLKF